MTSHSTKNLPVTSTLVVLLWIAAFASPVARGEIARTVDLIEITDTHGVLERADGFPVAALLAAQIKAIQRTNPGGTLVLAGGDNYNGDAASIVLDGKPIVAFFNHLGVEATAFGNHELYWGLDRINQVTMKDARYSILCANLRDAQTDRRIYPAYQIFEKSGVKIAVIGATTEKVASIIHEQGLEKALRFTPAAEEINAVAKEIRDAKLAHAVIVLIHEGGAIGSETDKKIFEICEKLAGVDAVLGGHSHTIVDLEIKGMPLVIPSSKGNGYAHLRLTVDDDNVVFSGGYVPLVDEDTAALVAKTKAQTDPILGEVLCRSDVAVTEKTAKPYGDATLGNWVCGVMRRKTGAEIALHTNSKFKGDLPAGDVTVGAIYNALPFDHTIALVKMKKQALKAALEYAFIEEKNGRKVKGWGIQAAGVQIVFDNSRPMHDKILDLRREDGSAIADDVELTVALTSFLANGGDGFAGFKGLNRTDTGIVVRAAAIEAARTDKTLKLSPHTALMHQTKK